MYWKGYHQCIGEGTISVVIMGRGEGPGENSSPKSENLHFWQKWHLCPKKIWKFRKDIFGGKKNHFWRFFKWKSSFLCKKQKIDIFQNVRNSETLGTLRKNFKKNSLYSLNSGQHMFLRYLNNSTQQYHKIIIYEWINSNNSQPNQFIQTYVLARSLKRKWMKTRLNYDRRIVMFLTTSDGSERGKNNFFCR